MTRNHTFVRVLWSILIPAALMAVGVGSALAEELSAPPSQNKAARIVQAQILDNQSQFTLSGPTLVDDLGPLAEGDRSLLVALPLGTNSYSLELDGPAGAAVSAPDGLMSMRGRPILRVVITGAGNDPVDLTVHHDGQWTTLPRSQDSAAMNSVVQTSLPPAANSADGMGSYLIVYAPDFAAAVAPFAQWKTLKGYQVETVSTSETGSSTTGIKQYIQDAYDTWDSPPEFVLLVADVDQIPTFSFYGNPSDQPYIQLEGDDWLPDAIVGRVPAASVFEAETMLNKIINYERFPGLNDTGWQERSLMVAGLTGSTTPGYTVAFCGDQLQEIGFEPQSSVICPPVPGLIGAQFVTDYLNEGAGFLVYRGWAQGTGGWDPPVYNVANIPSMETNDMTPIVFSFVCLNGDYTSTDACMGEVFVRQGSPEEPGKGGVAFFGNGEHWSHTRYNDALAISVFEEIVNEDLTTLGHLLTSGRMRFMEYFPHEMFAEDQPNPEESVEFYFHIYNLLGDPSMIFWRGLPEAVDVTHADNLPAGANNLEVSVATTDGGQPVAGARVGVVQSGVLIGTGVTQADGSITIQLTPVQANADISVTVTEAGVVPYEGVISTGTATTYLGVTQLAADDSAGNDDGVVNPGETLAMTATVMNHGSGSSGDFSLTISEVTGPATLVAGTVDFSSLNGGSDAVAATTLGVVIDEDAPEGAIIYLTLDAERFGEQIDQTVISVEVNAPSWELVSLASGDGSSPVSGETTDLVLTLRNTGRVAATDGSIELELLTDDGASLGTTSASLPACGIGETVSTDAVFDLTVDAATATGTNLTFDLLVTSGLGYEVSTNVATVVGPVNFSSPVGPDQYGYYAYDSADFDYADSRPQYVWNEISSEMGGSGTELDFPVENEVVWMVIDLPFDFQYYGETYSQIRVSDNGWISFDLGTDYDFYNFTIPNMYCVEAMIAPYWDNLNPAPASNINGIEPDGIYTYHDETQDAFIVEWSRLPHYMVDILGMQTFQVLLMDPSTHPTTTGDGEIQFMYRQINNNDHLRMYATVGIESPSGTDGLQLSYGNINDPGMAPLQPGLAVRVTTEPPVRVPFVVSSLNASISQETVNLDWAWTDTRPVTGWHVDRVLDGMRTRLTENALSADSQSFSVPVTDQDQDARYVLTALHPYGVTSEPGSVDLASSSATRLALYPAHPNPAIGSTNIAFSLPRESNVRLRVYDVAGRLVRTLVDGRVSSGEGVKIWDGRHDGGAQAAGGVYFYRLETGAQTLTRKMILVR